jgi:hypothetical protein
VLLLVLIVGLVVQPLVHDFGFGLFLYDTLLALGLVTAFWAVFERKRDRVVALAILLPGLASNWLSYGPVDGRAPALQAIYCSCVVVFLAFAVAVILRGLFGQQVILVGLKLAQAAQNNQTPSD